MIDVYVSCLFDVLDIILLLSSTVPPSICHRHDHANNLFSPELLVVLAPLMVNAVDIPNPMEKTAEVWRQR